MSQTKSYAAKTAKTPLEPFTFERRSVLDNDVKIEIQFCGVCHSDLHTARGEWPGITFPVVPGHEIVGVVKEVGNKVSKYKIGDKVGVGCLVDSCRECASCQEGLEQYCDVGGMVFTYNSPDIHNTTPTTYGGYSNQIVVDENFVLKIADTADLAATAPLLCAGITTYSPLRHWKVGKGMKVGIVGLGGLGHMGLKIASAMGADCCLFTTSESKKADGLKLGAKEVIISKDSEQMKKHLASFDFILNTVAASHNLDQYVELLKRAGTMCLVGVPEHEHPSPNIANLIFKRRSIAGSLIGGIKETQEMLDFCAEHKIVSEIEMIKMAEIDTAYERMLKGDVRYRFVIDCSTI